MNRVLLTGGTGFLGRHCIEPLRERGFEIHAVSSRTAGVPVSGVSWHRVDLLAPAEVAAAVSMIRPTHLLHLAWYVEPGAFWTAPENLDWVAASVQLVRHFAEAGGQRAVVAGSCAEYSWRGECCGPTTDLTPATLYGASKHGLRLVLEAYARQIGLSVAWGRIFFLYGPHEPRSRLVPSIILPLLRGEPACSTSGEQVRDFLHIQDAADAFVSLLDSTETGALDVSGGQACSIREVVETIGAAVGRPELLRIGAIPARADEPRVLRGDPERFRAATGWAPERSLRTGLHESVNWWRHRVGMGYD